MIQAVTSPDFKMSLFHLPFRKETGPVNMATDMWLLSQANIWNGPIFRRYGWSNPEITFGYGQKADWVEQETGHMIHAITRRPTGGGIVRHEDDLTYCIVAPRGSRADQMPPMQFYGVIHQSWRVALDEQGVSSCLMPCPQETKSTIPGDCFKEPVGRDLMDAAGKQKLGGAAMKRTRLGMLLQGTLGLGQFPDVDHVELAQHFLEVLANNLDEELCLLEWPTELENERKEQIKIFKSTSWNKDRKSK